MNIDEAIAHAREVAKYKRSMVTYNFDSLRVYYDELAKCAEEHEQLADWLEELQQYREIGTVVECREAVEKQKAKKPKLVTRADGIIKFYPCPGCSSTEKYEPVYPKQKYCVMCGQKLDWSEE